MNKLLFGACFVLFGQVAQAQSFYDESTIQTIEITFAQSNWDQLLDNAYATTGDYIMATSVTINGTVFDSVGVKYKGNSTYTANQVKNPFHIELDTYKEQDYQGYKDIKLSNVKNDPSFVREVLSYKIGRQYMDAPMSNYANVKVNGTLIGLYSNSESISKVFLKTYFDSKKNTFVKCNPPAGAGPGTTNLPRLTYLGTDSTNYYTAYELKSDFGWDELIDLCDTLNNTPSSIAEILDVDRALWMLAFDNVLVNLDSYIGAFAQNYYLYRDDFNRFIPIIWDMNESFGQFSMTGTGTLNSTAQKQQLSHLLNSTSANYPLVSKLLSIPIYKRMYLAHIKTILLENFDNNSYFTSAQALQATIDASVQADPNKFYTYANFISNLTLDVTSGGGPGGGQSTPGISNLMYARTTYLLSQSDFTQTEPTISNLAVSNSAPLLNDVVDFTADVANGTTVYLGYRTANYAPFQRILMYDDGVHNDGVAGDGKYGVSATMSTVFFQFYIYAENSGIGKFSPVRAEHEYYSLSLGTLPAGDVVINEFLASNVSSQADQDGEYDDWIELYNNTSSAINLSNYYMTDDATDLTQWAFPSGTIIPANGYLIIWADNDLTQSGLHANFKLSASGEILYLLDGGTIVDQVTFGIQSEDVTYGRYVNGTGNFISMVPTYNAQNTNVLSTNELDVDVNNIVLYPNPTSTSFRIKGCPGSWEGKEIVVYSTEGKQVYNTTYQENLTINVEEWNSGIYILKMENFYTKIRVIKGY
jgi:hypothetical protein